MQQIENPILKGFNPDPSIVRVGEDYYIATSTFEWFPGMQIHHSRDLVNWKLITRPLNRISQLDMLGLPDSCGVWAPCLTYDKGTYYLVYSIVRSFDGGWKDTHNYLVTTKNIRGNWSEPIYLNSCGFDASLFHDEDGRKWYTSMLVDHRDNRLFGGIVLQEYDPEKEKLIGKMHYIFQGTEIGLTEGPHIYKKDGYYYLLLAEGGTEYGHAMTVARSKEITGPYEEHPDNPMVSARNKPSLPLQKSGHGDFVQTQNGDWYATCLVGRPLTELGRCMLGRETAIHKIEWKEGDWPRLAIGGNEPHVHVEAPELEPHPFEPEPEFDDFREQELSIHFQSLRVPFTEEWVTLKERPGYLRIVGRESLTSFHDQSMVARRIQHFNTETAVCLEFEPESFQHMAGLVCYYNTSHYHYLRVSSVFGGGVKLLDILSCDHFALTEPLDEPMDVTGVERVYLQAVINGAELQFFYALEEDNWQKIGPVLDSSILSDDYVTNKDRYRPAFTGAFVGMCCQDLTGGGKHADFDWFEYKENK